MILIEIYCGRKVDLKIVFPSETINQQKYKLIESTKKEISISTARHLTSISQYSSLGYKNVPEYLDAKVKEDRTIYHEVVVGISAIVRVQQY